MMFKGVDLMFEIIVGNIEFKNIKGLVKVKSISGFIDLGMKEFLVFNFYFKLVIGEIYIDFDVELDKSSNVFNKYFIVVLNGGGVVIDLEIVSGDIFFWKKW